MIGVLGGGESGVGAAILAKDLGFDVYLSDRGKIKEKYKEELIAWKVDFEEGQHDFDKLKFCSLVIKSPGIPGTIDLIADLKELNIEIISEIEWAYRHCSDQLIAITGTNGKTTTTLLTHHLLNSGGLRSMAVGNVGISWSRALVEEKADFWVCECSSFQLEDVIQFKPNISVVLNITPDHLDRYDDLKDYAQAKWRICARQSDEDRCLVTNMDIEGIPECECLEWVTYGFENDRIKMSEGDFDLSNSFLKGPHNAQNASIAIRIAHYLGLNASEIQKGLDSFKNESHRLERVGERDGLVFINDSKATNLASTEKALQSFDGSIIWIVGGVDKGNDYSEILDLVRERVIKIIALGEDVKKIERLAAELQKDYVHVKSMSAVVEESTKHHGHGVVLLSPACASFDLFDNYEDRGDRFKSAVWEYINE